MNSILEFLKNFNDEYSSAVSALTPFVLGIVSWIYYKVYKENKLKEGDAANIVSNRYFSLRKRHRILAVHQFKKSNDLSGYEHLGQNSRPDQWSKLINIETKCFFFRKVVAKKADDILVVIISRDGKEKWKSMNFNK